MKARLMRWVVALLLVTMVVGISGWVIVSLQERIHRSEAELHRHQQALTQSHRQVEQLEEDNSKLGEAYRSVKEQWEATSGEFTQLQTEHARISRELEALVTERQALAEQLKTERHQAEALRREADTLASDNESLQDETQRLKEEFTQLSKAPQISPGELEQLSEHLAKQTIKEQVITEQLLELSSAYDRLLEERLALGRSHQQPASLTQTKTARPLTRHPEESAKLASFSRELGVAYMALHDYQKAKDAFEQSLAFRDDPHVHATLALLYGRFLHNPSKAQRHAAKSKGLSIPAATPSYADAHGLPRKSSQLLWQWFVQ